MSVPRGQHIPDVKKNALISQFLEKGTKLAEQKKSDKLKLLEKSEKSATPMAVDEIVVID